MKRLFEKINARHFNGRPFTSLLKCLGLMLLIAVTFMSCSSEDTESPDPDPIVDTNPDPDPDRNPDPDPDPYPDPDPDSSTQLDISVVDNAVTTFMTKYAVPGSALAVSVDEKMVYSKGYGVAFEGDTVLTKSDDVFRIASISKVFTATAIMTLVDDGTLSLSDKVFGADGILGGDFGTATFTADELTLTVDHLLLHESGGWGVSSGGDPIDFEPQLENSAFIEYVLNNWELANTPGEAYSYSNMGYWLLARIIEEVSGESYETFVNNMLTPTGITSFKTTTFRTEDLETNEVGYYGDAADEPFIYTIASRRDGDGGVVISAPDLLRFMCAIDNFPNRTDLISAAARGLMREPSAYQVNSGRGLGIWPQQDLYFFTGSLPGNRSWFMIGDNGISAVILLNKRNFVDPNFDIELQDLLLNLLKDSTISWQTDLDQF